MHANAKLTTYWYMTFYHDLRYSIHEVIFDDQNEINIDIMMTYIVVEMSNSLQSKYPLNDRIEVQVQLQNACH